MFFASRHSIGMRCAPNVGISPCALDKRWGRNTLTFFWSVDVDATIFIVSYAFDPAEELVQGIYIIIFCLGIMAACNYP